MEGGEALNQGLDLSPKLLGGLGTGLHHLRLHLHMETTSLS